MSNFYLKPNWQPPSDEVVFDVYKVSELFPLTRRYSPTHTTAVPQVIANTATCTVGGSSFAISSFAIQGNRDSFCWTLNAEIVGGESTVATVLNDTPECIITVNGYTFKFLIESWSGNKRFGDNGYSVTGRSLTAGLARPNSSGRTRTESAIKLVSEIIDDELSLFSGYTATMELPDWYVYGKTFSYQNLTALQVINRIASTVGAVVYSAPDTKDLTITPYYRVRPGNFFDTDPEYVIDSTDIISISYNYNLGTDINAVRVAGDKSGVAVSVLPLGADPTETFWGGYYDQTDVTIDDITWAAGGYERNISETLITTESVAVLRGAYELDKEFNFYTTAITTFLDSTYCKLITPNLFIQVTNSVTNCAFKGLVDSVAITAQADEEGLRVTQSVSIESLEVVLL